MNHFLIIICFIIGFMGCLKPNQELRTNLPDELKESSNNELQLSTETLNVSAFLIILDSSISMGESSMGKDKFVSAIKIIKRIGLVFPEQDVLGGIRIFGDPQCALCKTTVMIYGFRKHSRKSMNKSLQLIHEPSGESPLKFAIDSAIRDLEKIDGNVALIIISDFKDMGNEPEIAIKNLKTALKDKVSVLCVQIGKDLKSEALLQRISNSKNAITTNDDFLELDENLMKLTKELFGCKKIVEQVAVEEKKIEEKKIEEKKVVVVQPCTKDDDNDGVCDDIDECLKTPKGAKVNPEGCWSIEEFYFDKNQCTIPKRIHTKLDHVAQVMKTNPSLCMEIQGYTDAGGDELSNISVSKMRAEAVMVYFLLKGINQRRFAVKGYGSSKPVGSNESELGRSLNRRVELRPIPCRESFMYFNE